MADDPITYDFLDPPVREGEIGRLGPYRVMRLIGKGGMGQVFAAQDARLKREVALKLMNPKIGTTMQSRKRFIEEARSMAAVHHDNVATIFEVGTHRNMPFIAMEMLRGEPLNVVLQQRQRLPYQEIIRIAREVATGLQAAHERGIIHRDIKPGNLWIEEPSGRAKILDFGLAIADPAMDGLAPRGATVGSPGYLSPEQARNDPVDDRTDLYSLGVVLYQACCGRLPLRTDSIVAQMVANICVIPRPLSQRSEETPQPLCDLIDQLLRKEPRERPATAAELIQLCDQVEQACKADQSFDVQIVTDAGEKTRPTKTSKRTERSKSKKPVPVEESKADAATEPEFDSDNLMKSLWLLRTQVGRNKVAAIASAVVATLVLVIALVWSSADDDVAADSQPAVSQVERTRNTTTIDEPRATLPAGVTAASLKPLMLASVSGPERLKVGEGARYELELRNRATEASKDPRRLHSGERVVAQIAILLQAADSPEILRPAFPKKLPPLQLPSSGKTRAIDVQFLTTGLEPGNYDVTFELQTPGGGVVSRQQTKLELNASPDPESESPDSNASE